MHIYFKQSKLLVQFPIQLIVFIVENDPSVFKSEPIDLLP